MKISRATILDVLPLSELCKKYWEEVVYAQPLAMTTFNMEVCREKLSRVLMDKSSLFLIAEEEGKLIGLFWFVLAEPLWTTEYYAHEQYFFVIPEKRHTRAAWELLNTAKLIAKNAGCLFLQVGNMTKHPTLDKVYKKRFTQLGDSYAIYLGGQRWAEA